MTKRRLSRQQSWRIDKIQREREQRAARRDELAAQALVAGELGPEREGLIVAHYGTQVEVEASPGHSQRCHLRANLEGLVTGDKVIWREGSPTGVVVAQRERVSELCRPDAYGKLKPVAANIDQLVIVIAALPEPHANLIDRYLAAAQTVRIEPLLLLNKTDLLVGQPELQAQLDALLAVYPTLGYRVLRTSIKDGGLAPLHAALRGRISVFVGQSGVGKSSLINVLLPSVELAVGALSATTNKGTHTTTTARLFHLPTGGQLIDSPGIREFSLWHMNRREVEQGFREFHPVLGHCKFRDCHHRREPGCAVLSAVDAGTITAERLASYRHIVASLENAP